MTGAPEAISDATNGRPPPTPLLPLPWVPQQLCWMGTPKQPLPGGASEWWAKQPPSTVFRVPPADALCRCLNRDIQAEATSKWSQSILEASRASGKAGETHQGREVQKATGLAQE